MNHLTPEEMEELRQELSRQLKKLERSMKVTDEAMNPVTLDQTAVGRLSRMDSLQNQSLTRNLQEREQVKLALIQAAFLRMEEGTYGVCVDCGGEIPFQRLFVFPEGPTCSSCGDGF